MKEMQEMIDKAVAKAVAEALASQTKSTPRALKPTKEKWFGAEGKSIYEGKMAEVIDDGQQLSHTWDSIRYITNRCMGARYVRDLKAEQFDKANEIAERICQLVYDCRREVIGSDTTGESL